MDDLIPNVHQSYIVPITDVQGIPRYVLKRQSPDRNRLDHETEILRTLPPHPNIVAFVGAGVGVLLLEAHGPDLFEYVFEQHQETPRAKVYGWLHDMASALGHLHELGYMHRDVKLENIVLASDSRAVLIDYEFCIRAETATEFLGTAGYLAPELTGHKTYTNAIDVFALGICAFSLLHPEHSDPWRVDEVPKLRPERVRQSYFTEEEQTLLLRMMESKVRLRYTIDRVERTVRHLLSELGQP